MITESHLAAVRGHLEDRSIALEWVRLIELEMEELRKAMDKNFITMPMEAIQAYHEMEVHLLPELRKTVERM